MKDMSNPRETAREEKEVEEIDLADDGASDAGGPSVSSPPRHGSDLLCRGWFRRWFLLPG